MKTKHPASKYGTDKQFLDWISRQPSVIDGAFNQYLDGEGRNIPAHVRRASNAGTAFKPEFSAVPLTDFQHQLQHKKGESGLLEYYGIEGDAKAWFDNAAEYYLNQWIKERS